MRPGMMIEMDKCIGCMACMSACKERWDTGTGISRDWVKEYETGTRGKDLQIIFYPGQCMHCEDHPCTQACPTKATYADDNGIVVVDEELCIGCGNCVSMCAYGARFPDPDREVMQKCDFCKDYVARGEQPACVETCLAGCRHYGDLDDPNGELVQLIEKTGAEPLTTDAVQIGPKIHYSPASAREHVLAQGVVTEPEPSWLTKVWTGWTRPFAQYVVPAFGVMAVLGGLFVNIRNRAHRKVEAEHEKQFPEEIERHRLGMRILHWFNAFSWLFLFITGTALMTTKDFTLIGETLPAAIASLFGGRASMLMFHAGWGIGWTLVTVPFFLYFKKGGIGALKEIRITRDDIRWIMYKPLQMLGFKQELPPQDKYNAGQKLFALAFLAGSMVIMSTGFVMTFHLGPAWLVAASILAHKLAIGLVLMGVALHFTMAAIMAEERPALKSMITGKVNRHFVSHHGEKWLEERDDEGRSPDA